MANPNPNFNLKSESADPDYSGLVRFLIEPLLEPSESICIDCEQLNSTRRVWLRLAINSEDKGRIYGRGNRNLMAIRTVLNAAAKGVNQSLYLDVYGGENHQSESAKTPPRRASSPKPKKNQN